MAIKGKIYRGIDHRTRPSSNVFVRATSKRLVAELLGLSIGTINDYFSVETRGDHPEIKMNEVIYPKDEPMPKQNLGTLRITQLNEIGSIGYLDAALKALDVCEIINGNLKQEKNDIREKLFELKNEVQYYLEIKYCN